MRRITLAVCFLAFLTVEVKAQDPQTIIVQTGTYTGGVTPSSDVTIEADFFKTASDSAITQIWIVSSGGTTLTEAACAFNLPGDPTRFSFSINAALNPKRIVVGGSTTNCPLTSSQGTSAYTIHFLSKVDPNSQNALDKFFELTFNTDFSGRVLTGTTAFTNLQPLTVNTLTPANYNPAFVITDNASNPVTYLNLGQLAKLRFTMTIPNFVEFVDDAGARITDCKMSQNADFSAPFAEIITSTGCFTAVLNKKATEGFTGSFTTSGTTRNFVAETPEFENINFFITETTGNKDLFFQCTITYCNVYSAGVAGNCGGPHCSAATGRKKRSSTDHSHIMQASVKVIGTGSQEESGNQQEEEPNQEKPCKKCDLSVAYKATIGALVGIAVILFFGMIFSYRSLMNTIEEHNDKMTAGMMSSVTSSTVGRSNSMPESIHSGTIPRKQPSLYGSSKTKSVM